MLASTLDHAAADVQAPLAVATVGHPAGLIGEVPDLLVAHHRCAGRAREPAPGRDEGRTRPAASRSSWRATQRRVLAVPSPWSARPNSQIRSLAWYQSTIQVAFGQCSAARFQIHSARPQHDDLGGPFQPPAMGLHCEAAAERLGRLEAGDVAGCAGVSSPPGLPCSGRTTPTLTSLPSPPVPRMRTPSIAT